MSYEPSIKVTHLFHSLDAKLIELLKSLTADDWNAQTVAKLWKVKDVAAHLLDGNLRALSIQRDRYFGEKPPAIDSYQTLVNWLNQLNADWVAASKRISPQVLTMLLELTGKPVSDYYCSVDLKATAIFAVSWAGEDESKNWLHIAREYTEKWLHQQQIRDAANKPGILTQEYYSPFLHTSLQALPHTFKDIEAPEGTCTQLTVRYQIEESWWLLRTGGQWILKTAQPSTPTAHVTIDGNAAWKLFSKSWRANDVLPFVEARGDQHLCEKMLEMVSFMA